MTEVRLGVSVVKNMAMLRRCAEEFEGAEGVALKDVKRNVEQKTPSVYTAREAML